VFEETKWQDNVEGGHRKRCELQSFSKQWKKAEQAHKEQQRRIRKFKISSINPDHALIYGAWA